MRLISIPIALGNLKKICDKWQAKWQLQLQPVQWRSGAQRRSYREEYGLQTPTEP